MQRLQHSSAGLWHAGGMVDGLVSTGVAAADIGVDPTTLQRWAHSGLVEPALRTAGGHFRWDLASLRARLQELGEVPERQPVVAAVVTSPLGVLVGKRNDGKPLWTFIAGEVEPGESPDDAAIREVKEETGLRVRLTGEIGRREHPVTGRTMIYIAALPEGGTDVFVGDLEELAEVRWVSLAEAARLLPGIYEPVHAHLVRTLADTL